MEKKSSRKISLSVVCVIFLFQNDMESLFQCRFLFCSVQLLSCVWLLRPHGLQHTRPHCPLPIPGVYSNSYPLSWWCHPIISSSVVPFFSRLQSFPASESFPMSQFFTSGDQSIRASASASVLPMDIQGWILLGLTCLISLQSKSLLQHHNSKASILQCSAFFMVQLTTVHDYWKNHKFDYTDLCQQNDVSAF